MLCKTMLHNDVEHKLNFRKRVNHWLQLAFFIWKSIAVAVILPK